MRTFFQARKAAARGRTSVTALEQEVLAERRKQEVEDVEGVDEEKQDEPTRQAV